MHDDRNWYANELYVFVDKLIVQEQAYSTNCVSFTYRPTDRQL